MSSCLAQQQRLQGPAQAPGLHILMASGHAARLTICLEYHTWVLLASLVSYEGMDESVSREETLTWFQKEPQLQPSCITWEAPNEWDVRILSSNLKTKAECNYTKDLLNHISRRVQLPGQVQGCWNPSLQTNPAASFSGQDSASQAGQPHQRETHYS